MLAKPCQCQWWVIQWVWWLQWAGGGTHYCRPRGPGPLRGPAAGALARRRARLARHQARGQARRGEGGGGEGGCATHVHCAHCRGRSILCTRRRASGCCRTASPAAGQPWAPSSSKAGETSRLTCTALGQAITKCLVRCLLCVSLPAMPRWRQPACLSPSAAASRWPRREREGLRQVAGQLQLRQARQLRYKLG